MIFPIMDSSVLGEPDFGLIGGSIEAIGSDDGGEDGSSEERGNLVGHKATPARGSSHFFCVSVWVCLCVCVCTSPIDGPAPDRKNQSNYKSLKNEVCNSDLAFCATFTDFLLFWGSMLSDGVASGPGLTSGDGMLERMWTDASFVAVKAT